MPLTQLQIEHAKPKDKAYRLTDSDGLRLDVMPTGGKLWRWRFSYNGKPQLMALGKYPVIGLKEARRLRDEARQLLAQGKHPTREKKAQKIRDMHKGENTFQAISQKWLNLKQNQLNKKYHKQCLARMEQHVFPLIGSLPITEVTIPDVVNVLEKIAATGTVETARRMKQLISQTFRYASQRGMCEHNPAADLRDILPSKTQKHHSCIPLDELPDFLKAIKNYEGEALTRLSMELMALTFVRTNEMIGAKWEEIDWKRAEWHIPKERMKMRRPHMVPLSRQTLEILGKLKALTGDKSYIFYSSRSKAGHISNGSILMALRRMGYSGRMTGHGFRTLASTILNEKSYSPDVIERQLAHENSDKIRSAYNRAQYLLERKKMMQDYADILNTMKNGNNKVIDGDFLKVSDSA